MVGENGKCPTEKEFVFYGNLVHPSESVKHMGDNLTGEGDGDDEQIQIDLSKIDVYKRQVLRQCARFAVKNMEQWMPNIMPKQQCGRRPQIRISRNMTVVAL